MNVAPITVNQAGLSELVSSAHPGTKQNAVAFEETFLDLIQQTDQQQKTVAQDIDNLVMGRTENLQQVAVNVAKADLSFRFVMEMRDRLISTYQEVMRMQI